MSVSRLGATYSSRARLITQRASTRLKHRISSYTWKAAWGPDYHQSMYIGIGGLGLATVLAFGEWD